ncbi:transporter substrate-binding domain-containing protein [Bacillus carboniphilus]|uniref:Transporter substrate-binding domain-containing protein n=1 Tax=Bacillus carboniphilus TaxID=86663 RepID=A0ABN0VUA0_9BACI
MNKKFFSFMMIGLLISLLAACGTASSNEEGQGSSTSDTPEKKTKLVMGTSADYPPFEFIDTANGSEFVGFDIDLATYITEQLGYELEIRDMAFDGLIGALQADRVDFVASSMSATEERKKNVDFSEIYFMSGEMLVTLKGSGIESAEDLAGKAVGVQLGSIQEDTANELSEEMADLEVKKLNKVPELIQELKSNRIDAIVLDQSVAEGFLAKSEDLAGILLSEDAAGTAIAFPKGSELTEEFNQVILEMKENGELDKLVEKWIAGEGQ